jgi:hypothetical protein
VWIDVADVSADGNARHHDERIDHDVANGSGPRMLSRCTRAGKCSIGLLVVLLLALPLPAGAHNGPPFPIIENKKVGPCIVALWTHPDVGTGAFYVFVEPVPGGSIPNDLKVKIGVRPVTGRLSEKFYDAERVKSRGQVQYNAQADFDRQELWTVRLILQSSQGGGEATADVEVTPPGFGRWDLLLYLLPFLAVAFLWVLGVSRAKRRQKARLRNEAATATATKTAGHTNPVH